MAETPLSSFDLLKLEAFSTLFAVKGQAKLGFEVARLGLESKASLFTRIKEQNRVKKHLADSFTFRLKKSFGEVFGVRFDYNWYGLFFNTGAKNVFGKDVTLPALQWQAAALNSEIEIFFTQIASFYADVAISAIDIKISKRL